MNQPQGHTLVDFDDDGDLDIVAASFDDQSAPVFGFENDGGGNFTQLDWNFDSYPYLPGAEATAMGDVDNDGDLDCLIGFFSKYPSALFYGDLDANKKF